MVILVVGGDSRLLLIISVLESLAGLHILNHDLDLRLGLLARSTSLCDLGRSHAGAATGGLLFLDTGLGGGLGSIGGCRAVVSEAQLLFDLAEAGLGCASVVITGLLGDDIPVDLWGRMRC